MKAALTSVAVFAIVAAAGWLALVYALQRSVLFPRLSAPGPSPAHGREDVEVVWLGMTDAGRGGVGRDRGSGAGGGVEAWYLPPRPPTGVAGSTQDPPLRAPALIFAHGNGELIDHWLDEFEVVRSWGVGVLLLEYPGYGRSAGRPSQASITRVALEAYDYLAARPDVDPRRIVAWGRSLGGGAACVAARERDLAGLVLESAFTSVRSLARRYGLFGPLVRDPFDNLEAVRGFTGPVLVIHGARDPMIPPSHGRALAAAALDAELVLLDCAHNDCPRPWKEVREFLARRGLLSD